MASDRKIKRQLSNAVRRSGKARRGMMSANTRSSRDRIFAPSVEGAGKPRRTPGVKAYTFGNSLRSPSRPSTPGNPLPASRPTKTRARKAPQSSPTPTPKPKPAMSFRPSGRSVDMSFITGPKKQKTTPRRQNRFLGRAGKDR